MLKNNVLYNRFVCEFYEEFYEEFNKNKKLNSDIVFLCIGTDRITGDCFGPLVGDKLQENNAKCLNLNVYGTLEKNVNASNLNDKIKEIYINYDEPYIIAIDSALSKQESIGKIIVSNNFLKAGIGIRNKSINIGDISIRAIIGKREKQAYRNMDVLQNVSLNMVMNLSKIVSNGIIEVMKNVK